MLLVFDRKKGNLFTYYLTKGLVVVCFFIETGLLQIFNFLSDPLFCCESYKLKYFLLALFCRYFYLCYRQLPFL